MNLSCLTCQGMKRTDSFADTERNTDNEKADNINKLLDGVDNRSWSGNLVARLNNSNNHNNSDDKIRNPTNFTTAAAKKSTNSSRRVPIYSSGPLLKTTTTTNTNTAVTATRFARSSSSYSRKIPVPSSGPLTRTTTTTDAAGSRLFGDDSSSSSSSSSSRLPVLSSSGPITLEGITAASATTGPPKLVRCGGMRRDWSFEDLRQMNSLKT